ncbi:hypothetical protein AGDE_16309 [Angomonas deanei]|uniref:Leucine Rich repeat n=1 Tax=Angomonas deanei TaxID=59799 RepID=A0A7G2C9K8_9TRYP|nr:hypothetical protein AGDE_16309 [Angomonas deanei]CAD2216468.1 hypothetical protein, conserved [Angomonas deanei]|eukprot:EPY17334.1 hypothetical protein AGDE_16309 [Angomonas deanei]
MFLLRNVSRPTACLNKIPRLSLLGLCLQTRAASGNQSGGLQQSAESFVGATRSFTVRWQSGPHDSPLRVIETFEGTESLNDVPLSEEFSKHLSKKKVAHKFDLNISEVDSLLPFAFLLARSEKVCLKGCHLTSLKTLEGLERLKKVELWDCNGAFSLEPLASCPNLRTVDIRDCPDANLSFGKVSSVKHIILDGPNITSVGFLKDCHELESLDVSKCKNLMSLDGLSGLPNLTNIYARRSGLEDIRGLSGCVALEALNVSQCKKLRSLHGLSGLKKLVSVNLWKSGIENILGLCGCVALEALDVSHCKSLISLDGLLGLQNLKSVKAVKSGVKNIRGLSGCVALEEVNVEECRGLFSPDGLLWS